MPEMFDRSDMHLALLADVMCGEELWPQLFGLAFHHDFSFPIFIFPRTASAACQYSLPIFTLSLTVVNPSDRRLRGGEASRPLITARADEGRRYPTGGSPSGRKRFVYLPYTIKYSFGSHGIQRNQCLLEFFVYFEFMPVFFEEECRVVLEGVGS